MGFGLVGFVGDRQGLRACWEVALEDGGGLIVEGAAVVLGEEGEGVFGEERVTAAKTVLAWGDGGVGDGHEAVGAEFGGDGGDAPFGGAGEAGDSWECGVGAEYGAGLERAAGESGEAVEAGVYEGGERRWWGFGDGVVWGVGPVVNEFFGEVGVAVGDVDAPGAEFFGYAVGDAGAVGFEVTSG